MTKKEFKHNTKVFIGTALITEIILIVLLYVLG